MKFRAAITGAHGVGKTTFSEALLKELPSRGVRNASLLTGLGPALRAAGVPLGSSSNSDTIAAVWAGHLQRERQEASDGLVLLERCAVDAIAYTRALRVTSSVQTQLYEEVGALMSKRIDLVVHLKLSATFADKGAPHETPELRAEVAQLIPAILLELGLRVISLDAAHPDSLDFAMRAISERLTGDRMVI